MATLTEIANAALEHLFVLIAGETADADDLATAIKGVRRVVARLPEYGGGRALVEESTALSMVAKPDARVVCTVTGLTVTLPLDPADGARVAVAPLSGSADVKSTDRKLEAATSTVTVSDVTTWMYRADQIDWVKVTALADGDDAPYPDECEGALEHFSAMELSTKFEAPISNELAALIRESRAFIRAKYNRPRDQNWKDSVPYSVQGPNRLRGYR